MRAEPAPGLAADWLSGWLAAVGVTVLLPEVRLSWSDDVVPLAVFHHSAASPLAELIAAELPDRVALERLVLMTPRPLPRHVDLETYRAAAERSRERGDLSLAFSVTDLISGSSFSAENLPHGGFDPPAPQGTTLASRVLSCRALLDREPNLATYVATSLDGSSIRRPNNGLGFDIRRIAAAVQPEAHVMVDPVVESLCFQALSHFPVRGNGSRILQRGWVDTETTRGAFTWPTWCAPLDCWGIDALLDQFHGGEPGRVNVSLGVSGAFASVPYRAKSKLDSTRGYGSERIA